MNRRLTCRLVKLIFLRDVAGEQQFIVARIADAGHLRIHPNQSRFIDQLHAAEIDAGWHAHGAMGDFYRRCGVRVVGGGGSGRQPQPQAKHHGGQAPIHG